MRSPTDSGVLERGLLLLRWLVVKIQFEISFAIILKLSNSASPGMRPKSAFSACFSLWFLPVRRISTYDRDKIIDTSALLTYGRF